MKPLMLAGSLILVSVTAGLADEGLFWVVGNRATNGDIWFADGPYRSLSDAKLARSSIGPCPNKQDPDE
jgi:hypothetical protein